MLQNVFIRTIRKCNFVKIICVHKFVENIGTQHHGSRNINRKILIHIKLLVHFHHLPHKSQPPSFASQRTFSDACIIRILVKPIFFENGHHSRIFHPAILNDSRINQFAGIVHIDIFRYIYFFEHFGHREHGPRIEKTRKMIVREMVIKRVFGYLSDIGLKLLQIFDAENFLFGSRIDNDKIAEPQIILYCLAKILRKGFRILIDKRSFHFVGILSVGGFGGSINQGDIFIL